MIIKKAFTLIELMISITIVVILTMATYAPYNYYQNKAKLKVTTREISQFIFEARNMAINGVVGENSNRTVGVYFDSSEQAKDTVLLFSYPHDIKNIDIENIQGTNSKIIKTLSLQKGIEIDEIGGEDDLLFVFKAITGDLSYFTWGDGLTKKEINEDVIDINFSFKNSSSENLKKTIKYFSSTNIIDY